MKNSNKKREEEITRKEALKKIGNYGKYSVLTALSTYMILIPQRAQAASAVDGMVDKVDDMMDGVTGGGGDSGGF